MYQAWSFTLRPTDGVTDDMISGVDRWCHKADWHCHGVEKEGTERHCHFGVYLPTPTTRSNVFTRILSLPELKVLTDREIKVFRCPKAKGIMYNHTYVEDYIGNLNKTGVYIEVSRHLPADLDDLIPYYPEPGDQQAVKPLSIWYVNMEKRWLEQDPPPRPPTNVKVVDNFLYRLMYAERSIEVISDPRKFSAQSTALFRFLTKFTGNPQCERCYTCRDKFMFENLLK